MISTLFILAIDTVSPRYVVQLASRGINGVCFINTCNRYGVNKISAVPL